MADPLLSTKTYLPKLVTVLAEGYGLADLRKDALAGLTVAIVALPLSMAIGVASGVSPDRGLYAAIIGGFLVSALGGSRFQIGETPEATAIAMDRGKATMATVRPASASLRKSARP